MRYRDQRYPSDIGLRLVCGDALHSVQLVNISTTGARLKCSSRLPKDALVTLQYLNERISARVTWSNEHETGVRFVTLLSQSNVTAIRGASGGPSRGWGIPAQGFRELI